MLSEFYDNENIYKEIFEKIDNQSLYCIEKIKILDKDVEISNEKLLNFYKGNIFFFIIKKFNQISN